MAKLDAGAPAGWENPFEDFDARYADNWPLLVREVLNAEPDEKQEEILLAVQRGERRISVVSGHGVGKTTVLAWCVVCMLLTRFPQKTICTAPTSDQLFDALYSEVVKWLTKLPQMLYDLFEVQSEQIFHRTKPKESFVSFRTSRPEKPEAMAGVHCEPGYVLLIGDEASGIPEVVFEAGSGSMSGHNATTLLAGNPVRTSGLFYDTHHTLSDDWHTIKISCVNHPRVSQDFVRDMAKRYGEQSNQFRVRVLGEFPLGDDNTIFPRALVEAALVRLVEPIVVRPVWGLDPARKGSDVTALCERIGNWQKGQIETVGGFDTMQVAGWVKHKWDTTPVEDRPSEIAIDMIGIGAGVYDRLLEQDLPVVGVNVSETPVLFEDRYLNLKAELYWKLLAWFEARNVKVDDKMMIEELVKIQKDYSSTGKLKVQSKKDAKESSPNRVEALVMTMAVESAQIAGGGTGAFKRTDWKKPLSRLNSEGKTRRLMG